MNQDLGLRILGRIMDWDDDRARDEFAWLKLMARLKYDGYRDFQAGMRFVESLATWLQQFEPRERHTAYAFLRHTLVYIGPSEMQRLVERFYPRTVQDHLFRMVTAECGIPPHRVLIEADVIAVRAPVLLTHPDHDGLHHLALLYSAVGAGLFHRGRDDFSQTGAASHVATQG